MDYSKKTRKELIKVCKEKEIRGYSNKKKAEILVLIKTKEETKEILLSELARGGRHPLYMKAVKAVESLW